LTGPNEGATVTPDEIDATADAERAQALARILTADSVVFDVGANRGQFARQLLAAVPCTVVCLEPVQAAYDDLVAVALEHPLIRPVRLGVAEVTGEVDFFVQESDLGSSLLEPVPDQSSKWATAAERQRVPVTRLDDYLDAHGPDFVDLLKTDCQGADAQVLRSAGRLLDPDRIGALLVELNFHAFYQGQDSVSDVLDVAAEHGYFLAGLFRHVNREGWLWWADALFLPNRAPFSTQFAG
jgi:FkbM family methyltransferase